MQNDLRARLSAILSELPDPRQGLPDPVFDFVLKVTPMINVDLLVKDPGGRTLMTWRDDAYGTGWHIPGGIIRFFEEAAARVSAVAKHELGAEVDAEDRPCDVVQLFIPRGHFISLLYRCKLRSSLRDMKAAHESAQPRHGAIAWIDGVPEKLYPVQTAYKHWLLRPA